MRKIDAGVQEVRNSTAGAVSDLSALTGRVTNNESDISALNGAVNGLGTRVTAAEGNITRVEGLIPDTIKRQTVATLNGSDYSTWKDMIEGLYNKLNELELLVEPNVLIKTFNNKYLYLTDANGTNVWCCSGTYANNANNFHILNLYCSLVGGENNSSFTNTIISSNGVEINDLTNTAPGANKIDIVKLFPSI
jgi:hypothetical protein